MPNKKVTLAWTSVSIRLFGPELQSCAGNRGDVEAAAGYM